jgi:CRISPR-associated endonuclease/helicase Cas3
MNRHVHTFDEALRLAGFTEGRDKQQSVFDAFRAGKHIILHAPTGWGKTFAVLAALGDGHCIYSLPLRVLVDSLAEDAKRRNLRSCVAHHGSRPDHAYLDRGDDPQHPIEVVFTTLDQSLSAFLGIPVGVSIRQGNILPAVIDASHLVFDEIHLFDPSRSWTTALFALHRSQQSGILLTATLSDVMIEFLEATLRNSPIGIQHGVAVIRGTRPFVNPKTVLKGPGFADLSRLSCGRRTLIIRNQVDWAKDTASRLRELYKQKGIKRPVYLLHSELLPDHRQEIEQQVRAIFAEGSGAEAILVATQVVEAGIDITCDVLHTDLCPPASFIQRAGRCARYKGESGRIYWHPVETKAPYRGAQVEFGSLAAYLDEELDLTPQAEGDIVNLCAEQDRKIIADFEKRNAREVDAVRVSRDYSKYQEMIRSIDNVNVAIGSSIEKSYKYLSISRSAFYGKYKDIPDLKLVTIRWDADRKVREKIPVERLEKADFVLLDPDRVGYAPNYGLKMGMPSGEEYFVEDSPKALLDYRYHLESYQLHIKRVWQQKEVCRWMIERLAKNPHVGGLKQAEYLVDLVIWAHDLGKLNPKWQAAHSVSLTDEPIAHSEDEGAFRRVSKPPAHAWIGAWAIYAFLKDGFLEQPFGNAEELGKPVFWAIFDHHGTSKGNTPLESYTIGYLDYLDAMSKKSPWAQYGWSSALLTPSLTSKHDRDNTRKVIETYRLNQSDALEVYYMLSYVLRRSDQMATALTSEIIQKTFSPTKKGNYL